MFNFVKKKDFKIPNEPLPSRRRLSKADSEVMDGLAIEKENLE